MAVFTTAQVAPALHVRAPDLRRLARFPWSRLLAWLAIALLLALALGILLVKTPRAAQAAEPARFPVGPAGVAFPIPDASTVAFPPQDDGGTPAF